MAVGQPQVPLHTESAGTAATRTTARQYWTTTACVPAVGPDEGQQVVCACHLLKQHRAAVRSQTGVTSLPAAGRGCRPRHALYGAVPSLSVRCPGKPSGSGCRRLKTPLTRDAVVQRNLRVPMPDGTVLLADRWAPRKVCDGLSAALIRTPYGRRGPMVAMSAPPLVERGFQRHRPHHGAVRAPSVELVAFLSSDTVSFPPARSTTSAADGRPVETARAGPPGRARPDLRRTDPRPAAPGRHCSCAVRRGVLGRFGPIR